MLARRAGVVDPVAYEAQGSDNTPGGLGAVADAEIRDDDRSPGERPEEVADHLAPEANVSLLVRARVEDTLAYARGRPRRHVHSAVREMVIEIRIVAGAEQLIRDQRQLPGRRLGGEPAFRQKLLVPRKYRAVPTGEIGKLAGLLIHQITQHDLPTRLPRPCRRMAAPRYTDRTHATPACATPAPGVYPQPPSSGATTRP